MSAEAVIYDLNGKALPRPPKSILKKGPVADASKLKTNKHVSWGPDVLLTFGDMHHTYPTSSSVEAEETQAECFLDHYLRKYSAVVTVAMVFMIFVLGASLYQPKLFLPLFVMFLFLVMVFAVAVSLVEYFKHVRAESKKRHVEKDIEEGRCLDVLIDMEEGRCLDDYPKTTINLNMLPQSYIPHTGKLKTCGKPLKMVDRHIRARQELFAAKARDERKQEAQLQQQLMAKLQATRASTAPPVPGRDRSPEDLKKAKTKRLSKKFTRRSMRSTRNLSPEAFNQWVNQVCNGIIQSPRIVDEQVHGEDYSSPQLSPARARFVKNNVHRESSVDEHVVWEPTVQDQQWVQRVWALCKASKKHPRARVSIAPPPTNLGDDESGSPVPARLPPQASAEDLVHQQMLAKFSLEERREHAKFSEEDIQILKVLLRLYDVEIVEIGPEQYACSGKLSLPQVALFLEHTSWQSKGTTAEQAVEAAWKRCRIQDTDMSISYDDAIEVLVETFSMSWWNSYKVPAASGQVGSITNTQFGQMLLDWGFADNWMDVEEKFHAVDSGEKGEIEFFEFCDAMVPIRSEYLENMRDTAGLSSEQIKKYVGLAERFGQKEDGSIPIKTMMHMLVECRILPPSSQGQEMLLDLLVQSCQEHKSIQLRDLLAGLHWCENRTKFIKNESAVRLMSAGVRASRLQRAAGKALQSWPHCSEPELEQIRFFMESRWLARVNNTTESEVSIYRGFFELYDRDNNGTCDIDELDHLLVDLEMKPKKALDKRGLRQVLSQELLHHDYDDSKDDSQFPAMDLSQLVAVMTTHFRKLYMKVYQQNSRERDDKTRYCEEINAQQRELDICEANFSAGVAFAQQKLSQVVQMHVEQYERSSVVLSTRYLLPIVYKCQEVTGGNPTEISPSEVKSWEDMFGKDDAWVGGKVMEFEDLEKCMVKLRERRMNNYMKYAGFSKDEVEEMQDKFDTYDKDQSGEMEIKEMMSLLKDTGRMPTSKQEQTRIKILIDSIDSDGSGTFDFTEFLQLMRVWLNDEKRRDRAREIEVGAKYGNDEDTVEEFRKVFLEYDEKNSGRIDVRGIEALLRSIGITLHGKDQEKARDIMKRVREADGLGYDIGQYDVLDLNFAQFLETLGQLLRDDIAGISTQVAQRADTVQGKQQDTDCKISWLSSGSSDPMTMAGDSPEAPQLDRSLLWSVADQAKDEGNNFFKESKYHDALVKYTEAVNQSEIQEAEHGEGCANPKLKIYLSNRAFCHIRMENFGSAILDATEAIELDPKFIKAYYRRGCSYVGLAKYKDASKDFKRAAELDPQDRVIRAQLAECKKQIKAAAFAEAMKDDRTASVSDQIDITTWEPDKGQESVKEFADALLTWQNLQDQLLEPELAQGEVSSGAEANNPDEKPMDESYVVAATVRSSNALPHSAAQEKKIDKKYAFAMLPTLVDIDVPPGTEFTVCGDVHGQYYDLINIFELNGRPSDTNPYLFNVDFVDRGSFSVECILLLFAYKLAYPNHMHLARGNHETMNLNKLYGFEGEVTAKYNEQLYNLFCEAFCNLPLAHVINNKIFCVHGGLFAQDGVTLEDIRKTDRKCEPKDDGLLCEMLWSDPQDNLGRAPSKRGVGVAFGKDKTNDLDMIFRSHEMKDDGYEITHDGKLVTVFSAPNYCTKFHENKDKEESQKWGGHGGVDRLMRLRAWGDQMGNQGAYIRLKSDKDRKLTPEYNSFAAVPHPPVAAMQYANQAMFGGMFGGGGGGNQQAMLQQMMMMRQQQAAQQQAAVGYTGR
eukprot:gene169-918_t